MIGVHGDHHQWVSHKQRTEECHCCRRNASQTKTLKTSISLVFLAAIQSMLDQTWCNECWWYCRVRLTPSRQWVSALFFHRNLITQKKGLTVIHGILSYSIPYNTMGSIQVQLTLILCLTQTLKGTLQTLSDSNKGRLAFGYQKPRCIWRGL